jgi:hypothetical protein
MGRVRAGWPALCIAALLVGLSARPAAASPDDDATLRQAYAFYIEVRRCWEYRRGAANVFISDQQMERARHIIGRIELAILRRSPELDKEAIWRAATADAEWAPDIRFCKARHGFLINEFRRLLPHENVTEKDF